MAQHTFVWHAHRMLALGSSAQSPSATSHTGSPWESPQDDDCMNGGPEHNHGNAPKTVKH